MSGGERAAASEFEILFQLSVYGYEVKSEKQLKIGSDYT